jgi:hypothetical protein
MRRRVRKSPAASHGLRRAIQSLVVNLLFAASLSIAASDAHAQPPSSGEQLSISVITFGRGDSVHQYFGHNAFVVEAPGVAIESTTVFNYGMFTFGPGMIQKFLKGRLHFWVGATELQRTAAQYARANRDVRLLELNLSPTARTAIYERLLHDVRPENREYLYDHYFDNCSTRVRDILDAALHGQLRRAWSVPAKFSLRDETRRYTQHDFLTEWSMMFGLSDSVDRPQSRWADAFLPLELETMLETVTYVNDTGQPVPLVASKRTLFAARRPPVPAQPARDWPRLLVFAVGVAAACAGLGWLARTRGGVFRRLLLLLAAAYGIVGGLFGSLVFYLATFSDHLVTHGNVNLLLLNPVTLLAGLLALAALARAAWAERALGRVWTALGAASLLLLMIKALPFGVDQDVALTAALLAPLNLGFALATYA